MTAIVTKRLLLVPTNNNLADMHKIVGWLNDKEIVKYSEQRHRKHNINTQFNYIDSILPPSLYRLIVTNSQVIGTMTVHVDTNNGVADMSIMIGDKLQWGKGYGLEAWTAMIQHLFGIGIRKIEAGCMSKNFSMMQIFMSSKMRREGFRLDHFKTDDGYAHMELWGRFNE